jgi:L-lactate dehydrogenase complex protein LldF
MSVNPFRQRIRASIADPNLQAALDANAQRRVRGRLEAFASLPDWRERRQRAHTIRAEVIAHLDAYLYQFTAKATENGFIVHRAQDASEANRIIIQIIRDSPRRNEGRQGISESIGVHPRSSVAKSPLVAKSKSMVSEEIGLNHALEAAGMQVVETDLGEYIVQLRGERPAHIITPAVHLRRPEIGELFHEKLGIPYSEDVATLTAAARQVLREVFLSAEVGISGVNFGVAETGTLCIMTNEGNGRMVTTLPPVHIALMGMERLLPGLDDLALFLSLLPRSATGQKLTVYTQLLHASRRPADPDGPEQRHLILVDNGRMGMRESPLAEALYCIRCGACLNACPVFRELGGHAYVGADGASAPYPGPIGSVVSPGLLGSAEFGGLAQASSLCGACQEACPVDIDLPKLLIRVRTGMEPPRSEENQARKTREGVGIPLFLKLGLGLYQRVAQSPRGFAAAQRALGLMPSPQWIRIPSFTGWGLSRDLPRPAAHPFRERWRAGKMEIGKLVDGHQEDLTIQSTNSYSTNAQPTASLADQFIDELSALGGRVMRCTAGELPERIGVLLREKGLERLGVDFEAARYIESLQADGITLAQESDPDLRAGLTVALAGVAETGTLLLTSGPGRSLTASLLPEIHMAILRLSDLLPDLPAALRLPEVRQASAAVLVSGPSRTADIEMTLTIGVHGPKELHVFLIDD